MIIPKLTSFYQVINNSSLDLQDKMVYTDTSFVFELCVSETDDAVKRVECNNFSTYLADQGSIMITGPKVHEELRMAIPTSIISAKKISNNQSLKSVIERHPGIMKKAKEEVRKATKALKDNKNFLHLGIENFDLSYIENTIDPVFDSEDLLFADAYHYAFAKSQGISYLATADKDYTNINDPNFHVILDTGSYLKTLIKNNHSVPPEILEYYMDECNRLEVQLPRQIQEYCDMLQRLSGKYSKFR